MIIWSGWGFLVALIVIINTLFGEFFFESIMGDDQYYQEHSWPLTVMLIISGVISWYLGKYFNKPSEKVYIDAETGEQVRFNKRNSLFFIKMDYWGYNFTYKITNTE
ncbi:hypothetical protein QUF99_03330 [Bacillus sp. DX4.1]|uniref:hypothetical protein n=1 Tax=Bacillus sp. DX4.1 TaxID=3055867 RepID=UPI0025A23E72|nr:hypothetical protein [Bacillus sp. DX4.1]MDM5186472.1 hypothetical protein [Bacillus sp. DX4.1]